MSVKPAPGFEEERVLQLAASLERGSEHPLAAAIAQGSEARGIHLSSGDAFESVPGKGARAWVNGTSVALGNRYMMDDVQVNVEVLSQAAEDMRADGQTVVFVAADRKLIGLIGVTDPIKQTTPEANRKLHAEGLRIVMLTGDSRTTAAAVASKLGIDDVVAEVLRTRAIRSSVSNRKGESWQWRAMA